MPVERLLMPGSRQLSVSCPIHTADATQLSSWVASAVCIEFATSSRWPPTKILKLNMFRIYPVELSCVGGMYAPVGCRDPVYNSAAYYVTGEENWKLGHDWRLVRTHRRQDATRLRCRQIVRTRRDCRQLVANSIHTADATQLDSWVASAVCTGH